MENAVPVADECLDARQLANEVLSLCQYFKVRRIHPGNAVLIMKVLLEHLSTHPALVEN